MSLQLVLCAGMHRSGTSLTASLLQGLGIDLPGDLIAADRANQSGYFENRSVVDRQERLLQQLGYWWPTERASHGMPDSVRHRPLYREFVDWLSVYLQRLCHGRRTPLAIKDPRTSLLLPAWREAAARLDLPIRVVICLRHPRDVCWSLVWRDGPLVGMDWSRAQRLWLQHHRALLRYLGELPAFVARYEAWLRPGEAHDQLQALATFLGVETDAEQRSIVLTRVRSELNHAAAAPLPSVSSGLQALHAGLVSPVGLAWQWRLEAELATAVLEGELRLRALWMGVQLLALRTPLGAGRLAAVIDRPLLKAQLGTTSLKVFRRRFPSNPDLRLHPLLSPAHLNREREHRGLPPLRRADDLFRHLLDPDLSPLNPHPWFDCRAYQRTTGTLTMRGTHPLLRYLRRAASQCSNPYPDPQWLCELGAAAPSDGLAAPPALVHYLHPTLRLREQSHAGVARSWGQSWRRTGSGLVTGPELDGALAHWPEDDPALPLRWLASCPGVARMGCIAHRPATGRHCWWRLDHWEGPLLAGLAGADRSQGQVLTDAEVFCEALRRVGEGGGGALLLALDQTLVDHLLERHAALPTGAAVLNLAWPRPGCQVAWLRLLSSADLVLECRPAVRAYLRGVGIPAQWLALQGEKATPPGLDRGRTPAGTEVEKGASLSLQDRPLNLGASGDAAPDWLENQPHTLGHWIMRNGHPAPEDVRVHALLAWWERMGEPSTMT
jgi:hypothetical protein